MADSSKLVPFILSKEGGYVNDKDDSGGATNFGITLATWRKLAMTIMVTELSTKRI